MKFNLRQYQQDIVDKIQDRDVACLPTGAGKSAIICALADEALNAGLKPLIIVPTLVLKNQFNVTLRQQEISAKVAVWKSAHKYQADIFLHDECHHSAADSWDKIFVDNPTKTHYGFTASPSRLDGKPLNNFKRVLEPVTTKDLVDMGYLVPGIDEYSINTGIELTDSENLEAQFLAIDKHRKTIYGIVVDNFLKYCDYTTKTIVFCTTIQHCQELEKRFDAAGVNACTISYKDSPSARQAKLDWFRNGFVTMLLNVSLISEGYDLPDCEAVLMCRYASRALYYQQVGRVLRKKPKNAIVLDFVGNIVKHNSVLANTGWADLFYEDLKKAKDEEETTIPYCQKCYNTATVEDFLKGGLCPICAGQIQLKSARVQCLPSEIQGELQRFAVPLFDQSVYQAKKIKNWERFAKALKRSLKLADNREEGIRIVLEVAEQRATGRRLKEIEKIILG